MENIVDLAKYLIMVWPSSRRVGFIFDPLNRLLGVELRKVSEPTIWLLLNKGEINYYFSD